MTLTKKQFWDMIDTMQIFLKGNNKCVYNGIEYIIKCDDINNIVELKDL